MPRDVCVTCFTPFAWDRGASAVHSWLPKSLFIDRFWGVSHLMCLVTDYFAFTYLLYTCFFIVIIIVIFIIVIVNYHLEVQEGHRSPLLPPKLDINAIRKRFGWECARNVLLQEISSKLSTPEERKRICEWGMSSGGKALLMEVPCVDICERTSREWPKKELEITLYYRMGWSRIHSLWQSNWWRRRGRKWVYTSRTRIYFASVTEKDLLAVNGLKKGPRMNFQMKYQKYLHLLRWKKSWEREPQILHFY